MYKGVFLYTYHCECGSPRVPPCLPISSWFLYKALARRPPVQQGCVSIVGFRLLSLQGCSIMRHCLPPSILARWAIEITQVANVLLPAMWYTGCESKGEER